MLGTGDWRATSTQPNVYITLAWLVNCNIMVGRGGTLQPLAKVGLTIPSLAEKMLSSQHLQFQSTIKSRKYNIFMPDPITLIKIEQFTKSIKLQ